MTKSKKPTLDDASKATVRGLRKGQKSDSEVVEEKNAAGEVRVTSRKVGQNQSVNDRMSSFNDFDEENILEKRIYRRSGDLPEPELGTQAEANRLTKQFQARISPVHVELFKTLTEKFPSKRDAVEHAIELMAKEQGVDFDPDS